MSELKFIEEILEKKKESLINVSDRIWELAELPYNEYNSCDILIKELKKEGFSVEKGIAGMPTAFKASFGTGKPVCGFLGEYDALDNLSQVAGCTERKPIEEGKPGHGCGHNLLGAGSLGAALALKEYLVANGLRGTVIYFGCPAEEGAGSKQFMARDGQFDGVDFVYTWHPSTINQVQSDRSAAIMGSNFKFKGVTAHAGASPHIGRSALDAAELMSVGANYLREHMIDQARIHYAYVDAGGVSPNVVQDRALVKYEVRSPKTAQVKDLFERVVKVAKGAALMTETEVDYEITMAYSDYIANSALVEVADEAFREVGAPRWDEEDYKLAKAYLFSYNESTLNSIKEYIIDKYGEENLSELLDKPLDSIVHSYDRNNTKYVSGSTDVGDVCYAVPTINFNVATACIGNIGHTWQKTGQSKSRIAYKGLLTSAKVMALAAIKTMNNPDVIVKAKNTVLKQNGGAYECPLPDDMEPPIGKY